MIGFLLFDAMEELDFAGPWEIFSVWHDRFGGPSCVAIAPSIEPVTCRYSLRVLADVTLGEAPDLSALLVPGGRGSKATAKDENVLAFVQAAYNAGSDILSVCTGARILAAAGVLKGKTVTTHHSARDEARTWPDVAVSSERYVRDGAVWTSAGVTAGMDLALAYVAAMGGPETAKRVAAFVEYDEC